MLYLFLFGLQSEAKATSNDIGADDLELFLHHRSTLEMYACLLHRFCVTADKQRSGDEDSAAATKPKVCALSYR
jgi:hypothetical protein